MFNFFKKNNDVVVLNDKTLAADSYLKSVLNSIQTISRRFGGNGNFGLSPNGKRNFNLLFGYGDELSFADYMSMYKRGGIARTVVDKVAKACWRDVPTLKYNDEYILKEELIILKRKKIFKSLERADILNRIGNFSVMLVGVADGLGLDKPVGAAKKGEFDTIYFNVYNYDGIEINKYDTDPSSPRFGLPVLYQLQSIDIDNSQRKQQQLTSNIVHYSRIVHLAEGSLSSSVEGSSSLESPWNALMDKEKVRGSSAEAYYRNSRQKLALETNQGSRQSTDKSANDKLKQNVENFQDGLEDVLRLNNMKANMLQPSMASPRDPFDICVEEISGATGIPVRLLTTKAGGTVTGSEDKATWNALVSDRQDQECTIYLLDTLEILANAGIIELPGNVVVKWGVQSSLSEKEKSESMSNKAKAFESAVNGLSTIGADNVVAGSVFKLIGLEDIELDTVDISSNDKLIDSTANIK